MTTQLPRLAECHSCHDPIRFVELDTGKAMPVQPMPHPTGNVCARVIAGRLYGFVISREKPARPSDLLFRPHYATCSAVDRTPAKPKPEPHPALF